MQADLTNKQKSNIYKFDFFKKKEDQINKKEVKNILLTCAGLGALPFVASFLGMSMPTLLETICYVSGFLFAVKATMYLRPGEIRPLSQPITLYLVAAMLVALPSLFNIEVQFSSGTKDQGLQQINPNTLPKTVSTQIAPVPAELDKKAASEFLGLK